MAENWLLHWLSDICVLGALLGCAYALITAVLVTLFGHRNRHAPLPARPVTLLKPLCGAEPGMLGRLTSFCAQDYDAPVQIVFGVQDRADPAVAVVEQLKSAFPNIAIELCVDPRLHGTNRKVSNLANMTPLARHDILVLSDSDIEVGPTYLADVLAEMDRPGIGAVTCVYHGVTASSGLWARLAALSTNMDFLPNAITALTLRLASPCFGSTIAIRRETLNRIGGFAALADCLADDYALGEAVRAAGYEVAIPPFSVGHRAFHTSLRGLFLQQLRAATTIKGIDPVGHLGALITNPFPIALIGTLLGDDLAWLVAAIALICRTLLCVAVERSFALERQEYALIPLRDLLEFAVHVASFFSGKVSWRGYRYRVLDDGRLTEETREISY